MADAALRKEYETPAIARAPGSAARVASMHRASNFNLKLAEVNALIAIAEGLEALAPKADPVVACVRTNGVRCELHGVDHWRISLTGADQ